MGAVSDMMQDKGLELAELLGLEENSDGQFNLSIGNKSAIGLFMVVKDFMDDAKEEIKREDELVTSYMKEIA